MSSSTSRPHTFSYGYARRRAPRCRSRDNAARRLRGRAPRSAVSTATTPSRPGLKSFIGSKSIGRVAADGSQSDAHPRRRHRAGADRGDAPRARGDRSRVRLGRPARGQRRDGAVRRKPASRAGSRGDQGRAASPSRGRSRRLSAAASGRSTSRCGRASTSMRRCARARAIRAFARGTRTSTS